MGVLNLRKLELSPNLTTYKIIHFFSDPKYMWIILYPHFPLCHILEIIMEFIDMWLVCCLAFVTASLIIEVFFSLDM